MKILSDIFIPPIVPIKTKSVRLQFEFDDEANLNIDEFWDFCSQNDKLQIELVGKNEIKITFPRGFSYSQKSMDILLQLGKWEKKFQTGIVFNHLIAYALPNGLILLPSFSWIEGKRFENLSEEQKENLIHLCPDFVIELHSASDTLKDLREKMEEYLENGAKLGWLIDLPNKTVYVYRPNAKTEIFKNAKTISGEDLLKDFNLDLEEIW